MGQPRGFLEYRRASTPERPPGLRLNDFYEIYRSHDGEELRRQGGRCMDCGVPFCHEGCPLGNLIPDWNDLVYRGDWEAALEQLHATNNFPEFTGLICPAPCESACVLDINDDPVTIEQIELAIAERGWANGWIVPRPPAQRSGRTVGVIGSGPAGMAVAAELNKMGHTVTVYERDEGVGGLMRFGVPDAKLEKWIIDRRARVMELEGVRFECDVDVGRDVAAEELRQRHDALVVSIGSRVHRDLEVPGRELSGVHFAMDYLYQRNRAVARMEGRPTRDPEEVITAAGKQVVVVGGGDTGMDCISNSLREGAAEVKMLDVYPELEPYTAINPYFGLYIHRETPEDIVERIAEAFAHAVQQERFQQVAVDERAGLSRHGAWLPCRRTPAR
jgi:glutamate synthase (NADPH) small chain